MSEPLWRLLLKKPSDLSCEECFAVTEFYASILADGGSELVPDVSRHLRDCPECSVEHNQALERLRAAHATNEAKWSER